MTTSENNITPFALLDVGQELGISRERVRQLEMVGLMKMRRQYECQQS